MAGEPMAGEPMAGEVNGSVRVTLRDVYEIVNEIRDDVQGLKPLAPQVRDHEKRLRVVERIAWAALGIAGVFTVVFKIIELAMAI